MRAIGVRPCFFAAASEATISAAAPSLTPEALPAVTVPPSRNGVGSFASASSVVPARGCSSFDDDDRVALALRDGHRRDFPGQPAVRLRGHRLVLAAHAQRRPGRRGETWKSSATFSPVSGIESTPYCFFISGLTKRQPIVVS